MKNLEGANFDIEKSLDQNYLKSNDKDTEVSRSPGLFETIFHKGKKFDEENDIRLNPDNSDEHMYEKFNDTTK